MEEKEGFEKFWELWRRQLDLSSKIREMKEKLLITATSIEFQLCPNCFVKLVKREREIRHGWRSMITSITLLCPKCKTVYEHSHKSFQPKPRLLAPWELPSDWDDEFPPMKEWITDVEKEVLVVTLKDIVENEELLKKIEENRNFNETILQRVEEFMEYKKQVEQEISRLENELRQVEEEINQIEQTQKYYE